MGHGFSFGIENLTGDGARGAAVLAVLHQSLDAHGGGSFRDIAGKLAIDEGAFWSDVQRAGFGQPNVAVDAGALVKPALELRGIHPHRHRVGAAEIGQVSDVVAEAGVTAFVMARK